MHFADARRLPLVALACLLVAPAAFFFLAALGRTLQPVNHEPARTLDAVVTWFGSLPGPELGVVLLVLPVVGLGLAVWQLRAAWADSAARADLVGLGEAVGRVFRRPALLLSLLVIGFVGLYLSALAVHAVAG